MKKNNSYPYQAKQDDDVHNKAAEKIERKASMDINQSAENFINNFRKQLMLQRLQSIENYENMLARGL
ncbi:uncharacterized protein [Euphorbia lathyris]|uniref:uncharacterized protein n=1 Tax=Euphorbia lathyris TaxID=212925 RepID=UPI0033131293